MGRADRRLAAEAAWALVAARLTSGLLPFRLLARRLGGLAAPGTPPRQARALSADEEQAVRKIRWAVAAVAPWMPFRTLCLQQAIAARRMLARRGIGSVLHLGLADRGPDGRSGAADLAAHAWLDAGGLAVTGYPVAPDLREAGRFI